MLLTSHVEIHFYITVQRIKYKVYLKIVSIRLMPSLTDFPSHSNKTDEEKCK